MRLVTGVLRSWLVILTAAAVGADAPGFCLQAAHNLEPTDSQLVQGSRSMPPAQPALAAYDWDMQRAANRQQLTDSYHPCHTEAPIFRYKVVKGVLYVDHDHHTDSRYFNYRMTFLEQLSLSLWLYKNFPDIDLVVDFTDHPQLCDQNIPFLRFSILNLTSVAAVAKYNITELLTPAWIPPAYAAQVEQYTRGFTIPSPEAWQDLALTSSQLSDFTRCMDLTHPWSSKHPKVFWRGQATGCSRGWPQQGSTTSSSAPSMAPPAPHLLRNKRVQVALRLFPYSPALADVGITSLPRLTAECLGASAAGAGQQHPELSSAGAHSSTRARRKRRWRRPSALRPRLRTLAGDLHLDGAAALQEDSQPSGSQMPGVQLPRARAYRAVSSLLHQEAVGLEGWADAAVTLSIDGYGPPFRLPQQLLLGSAVLSMTSPYQTWLDHFLVAGQHMQEFSYDLTNLEQQVHQLLQPSSYAAVKYSADGGAVSHLKEMASSARALVASKVNLVAQLDAFAWSIARYKQVCDWVVQEPAAGDNTWRVLELGADVFQARGVPAGVRVLVMKHLEQNFHKALEHPGLQEPGRNA